MKNKNDGISFKDLVDTFKPKIWLIILVGLILGIAMSCYASFLKKDTYTSQTLLMISKEEKEGTTVTQGDRTLSSDMIETYTIIIKSDNFLNHVVNSLGEKDEYVDGGWDVSNKFIRDHLRIKQQGETEIFNILVETENAELSYLIASAIAENVKEKLVDLMPPAYKTVGVSIVDDSRIPASPNSKGVAKKGVIGALVGIIITMAIIFIRSLMDVTIREKKSLEDNFDIPIIGIIPRYEPKNTEGESNK